MVSLLVAAGASANMEEHANRTPLFSIFYPHESIIDIVTTLLRAGASLDSGPVPFLGTTKVSRQFEELLNHIDIYPDRRAHVGAVRTLVASVRAAGSWKAHCTLPHKQVLRLRSLVARGRTRERLATTRAIRFIVRQGDNGIVWSILSFWRATD